jgi:uracil-DNA glycosylase
MLTIPSSLDKQWQTLFKQEFSKDYMGELKHFLTAEKKSGQVVYPPQHDFFNAFSYAGFKKLKVVIVGQDPYHGAGQAHGLSFSVKDGIKIPPSLRNIYKEVNRDLKHSIPESGNLEEWAKQGVLLLNASLSVREGEAGSHSKKGWLTFTQQCIDYINEQKQDVVFLSWGLFAHKVCAQIDTNKHCVIKTSHPSPLGATKQGKEFCAFLGSGCFSQANRYLIEKKLTPINWDLHPNLSLI